ncbi:hypothetical protein ACQVP2_07115 [Methylobacterium aquaticum]|uniref:hypothetical protein n=1 Tax=Methylobacterium aquaticum TaxID=270351 RepID=UPI003D16F587
MARRYRIADYLSSNFSRVSSMNFSNFLARTCRLLLTVIGAVAIFSYSSASIVRSLNRAGDLPQITLHPSPDGQMVAAIIRREGGHFLAPYCSDVVSIMPTSDSKGEILDDIYEVYMGTCSQGGPAVKWKTDHALHIDFRIDWDADGATDDFSLKNRDHSKSVTVSFAGREP